MSENRIIVVSGFRGSGKTTLASCLLRKQAGVLVYDPNEDPVYDWVPNTVYSLHGGEKSLAQFISWVARERKSSTSSENSATAKPRSQNVLAFMFMSSFF